MITRYEDKVISKIWTDENKFKAFLKIELALLEALEKKSFIPAGTSEAFKNVSIDPKRILEIEKETKHDIIAFCSSITEQVENQKGKFFHYGVTSSDIIDSALSLQIQESLNIILINYKSLMTAIQKRAIETKYLLGMGRSHGMLAEPLSFGQKLLSFYAEFARHYKSLKSFYENDLTIQISGAVGNYTILSPEIETEVANKFGLKVEPVSTQIIPRDRIAKLIQLNSLIASAIERFSTEIRHLHRSEVREVSEGFSKGQKGSSTMPHKKNPVSTENLSGVARVLHSHVQIASSNINLWHERDISHSSAERLYLPDNFGLLSYALKRLTTTIENLVIHEDTVSERIGESAAYLSSYALHELIKKTSLSREEVYSVIQTISFKSKNSSEFKKHFQEKLLELKIHDKISLPELGELIKVYKGKIDIIFDRTLNTFGNIYE